MSANRPGFCSHFAARVLPWRTGVEPARFLSFDPASGSWDQSLPPHPIGSQAAYMAAHDGEIWVACGGVIMGPSNPENKGEARKYNVRYQRRPRCLTLYICAF